MPTTAEPIVQILLFVALPFIALMLLGLVIILAMRSGRPVKFRAAGFGVSIDFSSDDDDEPNPKDKESLPNDTE